MAPRNGTHVTSASRDDEFWRRQDELLGFAPPTVLPITAQTPVIDSVPAQGSPAVVPGIPPTVSPSVAPADHQPAANLAELEARLSEALARVASVERQEAARDAALRAVVETFEQQLGDMEASHTRRLSTIRIGAENEARRILAEADARADQLAAGVRETTCEGTDVDGR